MLRFLFILPIKGYQKFISPKKGYRCAYSVKNGGTGCSGAVIEIIEKASIFEWRSLIKERFEGCKKASESLKKEKKTGKCKGSCKSGKDSAKRNCDPSDAIDCFDCGDCGDIGSCS